MSMVNARAPEELALLDCECGKDGLVSTGLGDDLYVVASLSSIARLALVARGVVLLVGLLLLVAAGICRGGAVGVDGVFLTDVSSIACRTGSHGILAAQIGRAHV